MHKETISERRVCLLIDPESPNPRMSVWPWPINRVCCKVRAGAVWIISWWRRARTSSSHCMTILAWQDLREELLDNCHGNVDDLVDLLRSDGVRWSQDDVITVFAICTASAWVQADAVRLFHSFDDVSTAMARPFGIDACIPSSWIFIATPSAGSKDCLVAFVWTNSMPQNRPLPRMLPTAGWRPSLSSRRRPSRAPCLRTLLTRLFSLMIRCTSKPALHASGWP